MSTEVKVSTIPPCDVCAQGGTSTPAAYDAKTVYGSWANLCEKDWQRYGVGQLGTGYGQRLVLAD